MTSFTDVANALSLPSFCMRKNPTPLQAFFDDLKVLSLSFVLYIASYAMGFHTLCLVSMISMNMLTFQVGFRFHELNKKEIHLNQFDELDVSGSSENSDSSEELSLKQREQGASVSKAMTVEQENKLMEQLQQVANDTQLRNRKRAAFNISRTPSSTNLIEEGEVVENTAVYPPIPLSDTDNEMPPLIHANDSAFLKPVYTVNTNETRWTDIPNFSQTHYLHNYMEEVD